MRVDGTFRLRHISHAIVDFFCRSRAASSKYGGLAIVSFPLFKFFALGDDFIDTSSVRWTSCGGSPLFSGIFCLRWNIICSFGLGGCVPQTANTQPSVIRQPKDLIG